MQPQVIAEAVLRPAGGGSSITETDEPVTDENVDRFRASEKTVRDAVGTLERHGFTVVQHGPGLLTISGDQRLFEDTFQTKLESDEGTHFRATEPLTVPSDWSQLIADVVLPSRPQLFP